MKCYNTEKYIMKYMDGEMTKQEAEELNQHIQECQKCKEDFLFYDDLLQLFEEMPLYEAPADFEKNVMLQIQALPEQKISIKDKIVGYIWGTFTILFGLGAVLVFYKESIFHLLEKNIYFNQWVKNIAPIEHNIAQQEQAFQTAIEHFMLWTDQILTKGFSFLLFLLCFVCAVQYVLLKRKKERKWK